MGGLFCTEDEASLWTVTTVRSANTCGYWKCNRHIPPHNFLCAEHFDHLGDGLVDQCPRCHRFKDEKWELCLDCRDGRPVAPWNPPAAIPPPNRPHGLEHSDAWKNGDREADEFFVYVLKLDNGDFYVGHTRELRERLSEHRDQKVSSTAGHNPKLQYFEVVSTREAAQSREAELKRVKDSNTRQIRRMIISFHDLVREIQSE